MRFSTRAFLGSFVPFAILLAVSFSLIRKSVMDTVREGLRSSLRDSHAAMARIQAQNEFYSMRMLRILSENAALKAGMRIVAIDPQGETARLTLVDQLYEICETQGLDLLIVAGQDGNRLAGLIRTPEGFKSLELDSSVPLSPLSGIGFITVSGRTYQLTASPVNLGEDCIGTLASGEMLDFSSFASPSVLTRNGRVVDSSFTSASFGQLESALGRCRADAECDVSINGTNYLSLPFAGLGLRDGYALRSFENLDAANGPVHAVLSRSFLLTGFAALGAAFVLAVFSTRSIVRPLADVVACLRESERTHVLPEFPATNSQVPEIRELTASFNQAAAAIREGRARLRRVYFGFIGSLASALDARDPYTAGHCQRVSDMATATAAALGLPEETVETIRIGALLHDIGKIGVPDHVLSKPGPLTPEEFDLIKQHCVIGRQILEPVGGFEDYIPIVELHHENWDGTGYPHGLSGEHVPTGARIVHVVDAYDAMTSNRPYRNGLGHEKAVELLKRFSGTQFDSGAVDAFLLTAYGPGPAAGSNSIQNLADAVGVVQAAPLPAVEGKT